MRCLRAKDDRRHPTGSTSSPSWISRFSAPSHARRPEQRHEVHMGRVGTPAPHMTFAHCLLCLFNQAISLTCSSCLTTSLSSCNSRTFTILVNQPVSSSTHNNNCNEYYIYCFLSQLWFPHFPFRLLIISSSLNRPVSLETSIDCYNYYY